MNEERTDIPPVAPGSFTPPPYDRAPPRLVGGFCPECNKYYFPKPKYCRACLGEAQEAELGSDGTLYSYTVIRIKPPLGLPSPYGVGYVDLEKGDLRIFCLLDPWALDRFRVGMGLRLAVGSLGHDGQGAPRLRPYFTPRTEGPGTKEEG